MVSSWIDLVLALCLIIVLLKVIVHPIILPQNNHHHHHQIQSLTHTNLPFSWVSLPLLFVCGSWQEHRSALEATPQASAGDKKEEGRRKKHAYTHHTNSTDYRSCSIGQSVHRVTRWLDGWPSALDSLVLLHRHNASILPLLVLPFQFQLIHALRADFAQLVFRVQEKIEEKRRHLQHTYKHTNKRKK